MANPMTPQETDGERRREARVRIQRGTAPPTRSSPVSPDALVLLYKLASQPDSAADALTLLHELQAHQVELDLQEEQLRAGEQAREQEIVLYRALFELAPVGYLLVAADGYIINSNEEAARTLGIKPGEGRLATTSLPAEYQSAITDLVGRLGPDQPRGSCSVETGPGAVAPRLIHIAGRIMPDGKSIMMIVSEIERAQEVG